MSAITAGWLYLGWGAVLFETNYGLMQRSPSEIKEKLLKALDKEYNVVDMAAVLEIVTILERTPITKEALETTRLGRDINELRRKTTNESLAKRAKDLVRRWRDLILPQSDSTAGGGGGVGTTAPPVEQQQQNGAGRNQVSVRGGMGRGHHPPVVSPAISLANSDKSSISPSLPTRVEAVPKTHAANKRLRKESPGGGNIPSESSTTTPEFHHQNKRIKVEAAPPPQVAPPPQRLNGDHYDSVSSDCEIVSVTTAPVAPPTVNKLKQQRNRKKVAKQRATAKDTTIGDDIVKEKIASIARTPKVKTTQELLAGLKSRSGGGSAEISSSAANCLLPTDRDVARNKTEHLARFLRSQGDESEIVEVDKADSEVGEPDAAKDDKVAASSASYRQTAEEILARLPPLDLDAIDWSESAAPSPAQKCVSEEDVDRVLNGHVEGLNGNCDQRNKDAEVFCEWHQVVSRTSYQGDLLHILPYVVID